MGRARNKRPVSVAITYSDYDQMWHGYKTIGRKPNGRPDIAHRTGRTRDECEDKIRKLEDRIAAGEAVKTGRKPSVETWFRTWLTDIAPHQPGGGSRRKPLAVRTLDDYWSRCENWIFPHLGGLRLDELDTDHLDRLYAAMYAAGCSSAHVLKTHAVIRRGLSVAMQRGKVPRNVAAIIDNPGAPSRRQGLALSREQAETVVEIVERRDDALRWKVGLAIGPRQGEALAIRWEYLDLVDGTVDTAWQIQRRTWRHGCGDARACGAAPRRHRPDGVHKLRPCPNANRAGAPRTCRDHVRPCPPPCAPTCEEHASLCPDRRGGGLVFCRPKTAYDEADAAHIVSLPWSVVAGLKEHRKAQVAARLYAGQLWEEHDLVFCQPNGRPLDPRADYGRWQDILRAAGLVQAGTHVMRHTAATLMLEFGEDLSVVQEALGHSDVRTTRSYQKVRVGLTRRAADKMDKGIFGATTTDLATARRRRRKGASGE